MGRGSLSLAGPGRIYLDVDSGAKKKLLWFTCIKKICKIVFFNAVPDTNTSGHATRRIVVENRSSLSAARILLGDNNYTLQLQLQTHIHQLTPHLC